MKVVLEEIIAQLDNQDIPRQAWAWRAFLLLPRLLLHRRCRGGKIGKKKLTERFEAFLAGLWDVLLAASIPHDQEASTLASRKRRMQNHGDLEHRVNRAMTSIQLGELFAGRMALEGADLAPRARATLTQMRQRTARPQGLLPPEIVNFEPASLFSLDKEKFVVNFCFSWRGTAGGPSGMTNEHFRPLHDNRRDVHLFFRVAELLPRGQVPEGGFDDLVADAGRWGPRHRCR